MGENPQGHHKTPFPANSGNGWTPISISQSMTSCALPKTEQVNLETTPTIPINENQLLISINIVNKNLLIDIDWRSQSIKIDNHSPMRLSVIDLHWLLLIINSWLCKSKKRYHHCTFRVKEEEVLSFSPRAGENAVTHSKFSVKEAGQLGHLQAELVSPLWPHQVDISA